MCNHFILGRGKVISQNVTETLLLNDLTGHCIRVYGIRT